MDVLADVTPVKVKDDCTMPSLNQPTYRTDSALRRYVGAGVRLVAFLLLPAAAIWIVSCFGGVENVRPSVARAGAAGPVLYILLKAGTFVAAPLSGVSLKVAAGALFGVWQGALYMVVGEVLGGSINFALARWLGRPAIMRFTGHTTGEDFDILVSQVSTWRALLFARLVLSAVYDLCSYAAGFSSLRYSQYFMVSSIGGILPAIAWAVFGARLAENPKLIIMVSIIFIPVVFVVSKVIRRLRSAVVRVPPHSISGKVAR